MSLTIDENSFYQYLQQANLQLTTECSLFLSYGEILWLMQLATQENNRLIKDIPDVGGVTEIQIVLKKLVTALNIPLEEDS